MTDLRAYARAAAVRAGIDPDLFERQISQESGFNPSAYNAGSGATGIAQIIGRFHPDVDPTDPEASLDYAATWIAKLRRQYGSYRKALAAYNWGPGNVADWNGMRASLPAETQRYLDVILGPGWPEPGAATMPDAPVYDPDTPPERQVQDWACSIRTATWMLRSLGVDVTAAQMQDEMVPSYVTPALGLLDGRGAGLAEVLARHLPEMPIDVAYGLDWGVVKEKAGKGPIGLGSHRLYHWLAVRAVDDEGQLAAMNPAPGYPKDQPVGDQLTEIEYNRWAPWALVQVRLDGKPATAPAPVPSPTPPAVDPLAAWIEALAYIGDDIGDDLDALPARLRAAADTIERSVDELRRVRGDLVGPRPAA